MPAAAIIAIINGALAILQVVLPQLQQAAAAGEITPEQQADLKARVDKLREDASFIGPEWDV